MSARNAPVPYGADHGRRLTRVRGYMQVANVRTDKAEVEVNMLRMEKRAGDVYYKKKDNTVIRPKNAYSGEEAVGYPYEFVAVRRSTSWTGIKNPAPRNSGNMDSRIPYVPTLNGARGKSTSDISDDYFVLGPLELPGRNTATDGGTVIMAGILSLTSNFEDIYTGDYFMVVPADKNEVDSIKFRDGDAANGKNGRVPWILKRYLPQKEDFYRKDVVRHVLMERIAYFEYNAAAGGSRFVLRPEEVKAGSNVPAQVRNNIIERNGNRAMLWIVQSLAFIMRNADRALTLEAAESNAIAFCLLSGQQFNTSDYHEGPQKNCPIRAPNGTVVNPTDDTKAAFRAVLDALLQETGGAAGRGPGSKSADEVKKEFSSNPLQQLLVALAEKKKCIEECVKGVAVTDMLRGRDGDAHLTGY
jgi:hypothetical protein